MSAPKRSWIRNVLLGAVLFVCCCVTFAEMEWASPKGVARFSYTPSQASLTSLSSEGWIAEDMPIGGDSVRGIRRTSTDTKRWILFLPGNGEGQLKSAKEAFDTFHDVSVMGIAYPGFDSAPGAPTKKSVLRSGELALAWIKKHYDPDEIHIVGFSLGSCVAMHLAAKETVTSLSILGTFKPIDIIKNKRYLFRRWASAERFDTFKLARDASVNEAKTMFIHGRNDSVVSAKDAERVARVLDKTLKLADAGHGDLLSNRQTQAWLKEFIVP